jgi:hypothetical protein
VINWGQDITDLNFIQIIARDTRDGKSGKN